MCQNAHKMHHFEAKNPRNGAFLWGTPPPQIPPSAIRLRSDLRRVLNVFNNNNSNNNNIVDDKTVTEMMQILKLKLN